MLQLQTVAKKLNAKLNAAIPSFSLNEFHANTVYEFVVYTDVGEYKKAIKRLNTITKYINCFLRINGDEKAGITDETINALWSCQFEAMVPDIKDTVTLQAEGGEAVTIRFIDAVADLINTTLAASTQEYIKGEDGILYYLGASYSNAISGNVDIRSGVGESLPLAVYIDYTVIATGLSSADIKLELLNPSTGAYERIYPTRLDIARSSVQEGNLSSTDVGVSKATTQGTMLTISISKPLRNDALDALVKGHIVLNSREAQTYRLTVPHGAYDEDTDEFSEADSAEYTMCISDASIAAETNLAAACQVTLAEEFPID